MDDVELTEQVAAAIGGELAACGVNLDLAPVADVNSDERNPIIGVRSFGSDPGLVARHTAAFVAGLQRMGVAACAKHFPGHGATHADSHLELPTIEVDRETLLGARARPVPGRDRGGRAVDHDRAHPRSRARRAAGDAQPRAPHRPARARSSASTGW